MTDFAPRIARLEQICAALFGKLLAVDDDVAKIEVPADLASAAAGMLGASGFSAYIIGQDCRQAPKRVVDMEYRTIVTDQMTTQAFYVFRVELQDRPRKVLDPLAAVANITRQVKP